MDAFASDVDGDSYADLRFNTASGAGYVYDSVWLYDAERDRFGPELFFNGALLVDSTTEP